MHNLYILLFSYLNLHITKERHSVKKKENQFDINKTRRYLLTILLTLFSVLLGNKEAVTTWFQTANKQIEMSLEKLPERSLQRQQDSQTHYIPSFCKCNARWQFNAYSLIDATWDRPSAHLRECTAKNIWGFKKCVFSKARKFSHVSFGLYWMTVSIHRIRSRHISFKPLQRTYADTKQNIFIIVQFLLHDFYNPITVWSFISVIFQRREVIRHLVLRNLAKTFHHSEDGTESIDSDEENDNDVTVPFEESGLDSSL